MSATGQVTMSSVILVPLALWTTTSSEFSAVSFESWISIAGLALLSTAVAYVLYFRILATAGATNLLLVTFLIPVTAILLGVFFLGERLQTVEFIGVPTHRVLLILIPPRAEQCLAKRSSRTIAA